MNIDSQQASRDEQPAPARLAAFFLTILAALGEYLTRTVSLFWLGPAVVALVVIPEFAQHVAEIHLGMFASADSFRARSADPLRMGFGYVKIAGLSLAFLASARFWWCRAHGERWYDIRRIAWGRLLLGFILFMAIGSLAELAQPLTGNKAPIALVILASLLSFPFLFVMIAGLFGDRATPLKALAVRSWPWILLLALLLPILFGPLFLLHGLNHKWALGAPGAAVWALMAFDSIVVGLMASSVGAALFTAYDRFHRSIAR
ncbi:MULTISPECIES: hypothetical protein [unclassified Sphingopyxis]|uniref:hypothetical protein n=1 Tax=unclassified Sphingopyxis TaxID=2614943 RepID=UPI0007373B71|nr:MULTISPECIES: hypothetical protein [unclassified Sphingopyxis]KTE26112.1 hypothetical protein ATE62_22195 [Sphingopyxis sp. HIX]KTE73373.1 hypothetical protein ATE72_21840 [Sphingopyxis sp. HXXIV]